MGSSRSNARIIRFAVFALILIGCGFILSRGSYYNADVNPGTNLQAKPASDGSVAGGGEQKADSNVDNAAGNGGNVQAELQIANQNVPAAAKPKAEGANKKDKIKATFVSLARNSDLNSLLGSIRQIEDRFNHKFNYDWVFLNDQPFSDEFKEVTSAVVSGTTKYGLIPEDQWSFPPWIDQEKAALTREQMKEKGIIYGDSKSYRHMCRYESGFFWRHELMMDYDYYWRVEPDIKIYCDIDYDVFKWMSDNNKAYGFTISLPEYKETIPTLWDVTKKFIKENPQHIAKNNLMEWISTDNGETYNGCHFWSNFEIASLKLWRSEAYTSYFETLDKNGGFFYERWGDAPIHSIAAALFLQKDQIHFFDDVGYYHVPFHNCPVSKETRLKNKCVCNPDEDFTWKGYSCTTRFYTINNLPRPKGWENFT